MEARKLWPGKMSVKESQLKINETRNFLYEYLHPGKELTAVILTSLALDMLGWLLKRVSGRKAESVRAALSAVNRLHRYFDRNLTKLNDYREAKKIAEGFYREVAA
jgi:predicted nucleic acid-binding protein